MADPGVGGWAKGARPREPGLTNFVGENLPVLAKGDHVNWGSRVNLYGHLMSAILFGKLEQGVERDLAV